MILIGIVYIYIRPFLDGFSSDDESAANETILEMVSDVLGFLAKMQLDSTFFYNCGPLGSLRLIHHLFQLAGITGGRKLFCGFLLDVGSNQHINVVFHMLPTLEP